MAMDPVLGFMWVCGRDSINMSGVEVQLALMWCFALQSMMGHTNFPVCMPHSL